MPTWETILTDGWNLIMEVLSSPQGQKFLSDIEGLLGVTPAPPQGKTGNSGNVGVVGEPAPPASFVASVEQKAVEFVENKVLPRALRGKQSSTTNMKP